MDERVAIVSGAAGGLGAAIADRLAGDGFSVAGFDAEIDVTDPAAVHEFVAGAGAVDVVVTAAGIQRTGPSDSFDHGDWRAIVEVNLTGTWNVIQAALPGMLERGRGRIVTISSEVGLAGLARYAAYAASKGGVIALTKSLARELAPQGICVNCVAPGPVETGMLVRGPSYSPEWLAANVPLGRFGQPSEVAACVALLAGDEGGYFVGQVLSPNGGTVI
jgi:NAD(P)-dependent dehydrogenase (short-subunit alcohol dehydrogenase family)